MKCGKLKGGAKGIEWCQNCHVEIVVGAEYCIHCGVKAVCNTIKDLTPICSE